MIKVALILFITIFANPSFGQQTENHYLLVRIDVFVNTNGKDYYYTINAEGGSDLAGKLYSLKKYSAKKEAQNNEAAFYHQVKDTAASLYNFFVSPTEALNYISKSGLNLFSIYTEISSGYDSQRSGSGDIIPITTVSSRPVFVFTNNKWSLNK
jgi:hypothetical protein